MRSLKKPELAIGVGGALLVLAAGLAYPDEIAGAVRWSFRPRTLASIVSFGFGAAIVVFAFGHTGRRRWVEIAVARLRTSNVSVTVALPLIVALSASLRIALGHAAATPRVFGDELSFSSLAKSLALGGDLLVRGERELGYGVLYSAVVSPAYAFAPDGASAFVAIQDLNAIIMSLTAVPAYFLARRVLSHRWSLLAAVIAVAVPPMNYTTLVMTEPLFYPGFVSFALALVLALERPTVRRQALVVGLLLALGAVRAQAVVLAPAVALAVALRGARGGELRLALARFAPTWGVFAAGGALGLVAWVGAGLSPVGAYGALARSYNVYAVVKWMAWNLADLELAVGVVGLAVLPVAVSHLLRRDASLREHAFGSAAVALVFWTLVSVAFLSASPYGLGRLHERNLFYVFPLLGIFLVHWLSRGLPRPKLATGIGVVAALALPSVLPGHFVLDRLSIDAPTMIAWNELHDRLSWLWPRALVIAGAVVGVSVFLVARRPALPLVTIAAAFVGVAMTTDWKSPLPPAQASRLAWVDDALPAGARATLVHVDLPKGVCPVAPHDFDQRVLEVWTEFFNTNVEQLASVFGQLNVDGLHSPQLTLARDGSLRSRDHPIRPEYVVVDSRLALDGARVASFDGRTLGEPGYKGGLTLWRTPSAVRLADAQHISPRAQRKLICTIFIGPLLNTSRPSIRGSMVVGRTLTARPGSWMGKPPIGFLYRWLRCNTEGGECISIRGARGRIYRLTADDLNHKIRLRVTARNSLASRATISGEAPLVALPS